MAVRSRRLNSTTPWGCMEVKGHKGQKEHVEGQFRLVGQTGSTERSGEEDPPPCEILPLLRKVLDVGTAGDMTAGPQGTEKLSPFVAQAVCDEQQEFSPSCSERGYIGSPNCLVPRVSTENNVAYGAACKESPSSPSRSHRRREQRRRQRERQGGGEAAPSRVPEQESNSFPTQDVAAESTSRCSSYSSPQSLGVQETEGPRFAERESPLPSYTQHQHHSQALPRAPQPWFSSVNILKISLCSQDSASQPRLSGQDNWSLARFGLRGNVCQEDQVFAAPFFKEVAREAGAEDEGQQGDSDTNEGLLFHPEEKLQANQYEYKEGRDYSLLQHIRNGSYGDVYSVRDNRTGFRCAAKRIPLKQFNSEEVGSWSAQNSRRVVELYGAVRQGPWVTLFMPLKSGSVGQLVRQRGRLPEDLALHYALQVSRAMEDVHRIGVLHLDIKADNILLSEDGKETFLSDFGHSERLNQNGWSTKANSGGPFPGTETHMAPEVVKGEPRGTKADVWSFCCMLLHMLNGCHPWARYYSSPLCLKIANEDPPLREIPSNCNPFTADVIKAGLQKDPIKRASATEMKEKSARALMEVGGLTSPVQGAYQEPAKAEPANAEPMETPHMCSGPLPSPLAPPIKGNLELGRQCGTSWRGCSKDRDQAVQEEGRDTEWFSSSSRPRPQLHPYSSRQPKGEEPDISLLAWELEKEFCLSSLSQPYSLELQEQLLSSLSSDYHLQREPQDKDSVHWSVGQRTLSSGVFSGSSQEHSFGVDWPGSAHFPSPRSFEGVDVCIQDFNGQCLRIRESPGVTVGYIATGISDQISERAFCLETQDGRPVCPQEKVLDSGLWLRCTSTPDCCPSWRWRVRQGVLEMRE
ncbi:mitogen-activated protein kinase kinase kinase 14-like [Conger conger]|uniref:mitogen-activated protein kinase kinase kinase 14-like n=1 Tax=Conger conger TaxID=82655 RepID=UPI002A59B9F1|nr:mitogen-activated protein kinase kinase kinase 14-like [Conger conger]